MRNLRRSVVLLGGILGCGFTASLVVAGCSGDDTNLADGGKDGTADQQADVQPGMDAADVIDTGIDGEAGVDAGPFVNFPAQLGVAFCQRIQTCCNTTDAGPFDFARCVQVAGGSVWNGSNEGDTAEARARGNLAFDQTAAAACLAGVTTLSCPTMTSVEYKDITNNCMNAITGTLAQGAACMSTIECPKTMYCKYDGVDAGKTDAGTPLGVCTPLQTQGQGCGAGYYGDPNFLSTECAYKGWQSPALFCSYDNYPNGGYTCTPLRANNAPCYFDNECASGLCEGTDCVNIGCTCATSRKLADPLCNQFKIKDAGPG